MTKKQVALFTAIMVGKNMEKIQYETAGYITQTVRLNHLKNIIIETGTENAFYPEENRFVLSKDNSFVIYNLLYECKELESVDFTNFDFTETVSMSGWFVNCHNLKDIIFPKNVVCKNLWNLRRCFRRTAITELDLSSWSFESPIEFKEFIVACPLLESVKLSEMKVKDAIRVIYSCEKLKTIEAPIKLTKEATIARFVFNCKSLEVLDVSKAKLDSIKSNTEVLLSDENFVQNPDKCIVLIE